MVASSIPHFAPYMPTTQNVKDAGQGGDDVTNGLHIKKQMENYLCYMSDDLNFCRMYLQMNLELYSFPIYKHQVSQGFPMSNHLVSFFNVIF
jgi:hypothetical protein